jgi:hypothetical protein
VVAVAHRRLGPSSSATTSATERALPSSAVQAPLLEPAHDHHPAALGQRLGDVLAWSCHTTTVKNDASCSRGPLAVARNMALD